MKKIILALGLLLGSFAVTPAQAAVATDNALFLAVTPGVYTVTSADVEPMFTSTVTGFLAASTKVVFSYTLDPAPTTAYFTALTGLASSVSGKLAAQAIGVGSSDMKTSSDSLVTASANIESTAKGTVTFTNLSSQLVSFQSILTSMLGAGAKLTITAAVTSVPLPAALPLFGMGLASLGLYRRRQKTAA